MVQLDPSHTSICLSLAAFGISILAFTSMVMIYLLDKKRHSAAVRRFVKQDPVRTLPEYGRWILSVVRRQSRMFWAIFGQGCCLYAGFYCFLGFCTYVSGRLCFSFVSALCGNSPNSMFLQGFLDGQLWNVTIDLQYHRWLHPTVHTAVFTDWWIFSHFCSHAGSRWSVCFSILLHLATLLFNVVLCATLSAAAVLFALAAISLGLLSFQSSIHPIIPLIGISIGAGMMPSCIWYD
jgi:hypothetical protein